LFNTWESFVGGPAHRFGVVSGSKHSDRSL
jgi:hypothetical protein